MLDSYLAQIISYKIFSLISSFSSFFSTAPESVFLWASSILLLRNSGQTLSIMLNKYSLSDFWVLLSPAKTLVSLAWFLHIRKSMHIQFRIAWDICVCYRRCFQHLSQWYVTRLLTWLHSCSLWETWHCKLWSKEGSISL